MDTFSSSKRSEIMRNVKSKNTSSELLVRKFLFKHGFRFRIHPKTLPGTPDIVLKRYKTIILVHGCFWHGHEDCNKAKLPKTRIKFWSDKIEKNKSRDILTKQKLVELGWRIIEIFQCELKPTNIDSTMKTVIEKIKL